MSEANRVRVSAPDAPLATLSCAPTLTRLTPFGTLSRQAGEGLLRRAPPYLNAYGEPGDEELYCTAHLAGTTGPPASPQNVFTTDRPMVSGWSE